MEIFIVTYLTSIVIVLVLLIALFNMDGTLDWESLVIAFIASVFWPWGVLVGSMVILLIAVDWIWRSIKTGIWKLVN